VFARILVGFDGSESARKALQTALQVAQVHKSEITAMTVVRPPEFAELEAEVAAAAEDAKRQMAQTFKWARDEARRACVSLKIRVQTGHPAEALVRIAEEEQFDLIILGRRGLTQVQRWMLGSVSERVVRYAHCPVMVVH
jgi:nucleotide-binding universal stress UspA family protein